MTNSSHFLLQLLFCLLIDFSAPLSTEAPSQVVYHPSGQYHVTSSQQYPSSSYADAYLQPLADGSLYPRHYFIPVGPAESAPLQQTKYFEQQRPSLRSRLVQRYLPSFLRTRSDQHREHSHSPQSLPHPLYLNHQSQHQQISQQQQQQQLPPPPHPQAQYYYIPVAVQPGEPAVGPGFHNQLQQSDYNNHAAFAAQAAIIAPAGIDRQKIYVGTILHDRDLKPNLIQAQYTRNYHATDHEQQQNTANPRTMDTQSWREAHPSDESTSTTIEAPRVETDKQEHPTHQVASSTTDNRYYTERSQESAMDANKAKNKLVDTAPAASSSASAEPRFLIIIACFATLILFVLILVMVSSIRNYYKNSSRRDIISHWSDTRPRVATAASTFDPQERSWYYGNFTTNAATHR